MTSRRLLAALSATLLVAGGLAVGASPARAEDVGLVGFSYGDASAPTGQKPQSKLWYAHGLWWGSLYNAAVSDFHIYRFGPADNAWHDTGVLVEPRKTASMDVLWDGTHLYVASAGKDPNNTGHSPELRRYTYSAASQSWVADAGYPVRIATGGVEAVVIAKDSRGVLWATFTMGAKVYLTHSNGADNVWVSRYEVPTPASESNVDPDDISAVIDYDGDKIGVFWSNQRTSAFYFATHLDGTWDRAWSLDVAYSRPEGADDHMNLKQLVSDPSGRVFAVVKHSLDAADDQEISVLVLRPDGSWLNRPVWTVADGHSRAILLVDEEHRELYVFGVAPCCSGGTVYYKKSSLSDISFASGDGTRFIASGANPNVNNPTSTKQNLDSSTGLLVLAGDDKTHRYLYNRLALGAPPPDTTPPDTTITAGPPATTSSATATFEFTSTEPGSTFACRLDGGSATACTSPSTHADLAPGDHTFSVAATDAAGNTDPTPATAAWRVTEETAPLFADDFSSGGFSAGGWLVATAAGGTATVETGAVRTDDPGARLVSSTATGAYAYIRKDLATAPAALSLSATVKVASQTTSAQTFSLVRWYDSAGTKIMNVDRDGPTGRLVVWHSGQSVTTASQLPLGSVATLAMRLENGPSGDLVVVTINGVEVFRAEDANLGNGTIKRLLVGDNSTRRAFDYRADDVRVTP